MLILQPQLLSTLIQVRNSIENQNPKDNMHLFLIFCIFYIPVG